MIKCLQSPTRHLAIIDDQLGEILLNDFQFLFSTKDIDLSLLNYIQVTSLSIDQQTFMLAEVTNEEIYKAVKQLGAWKAPGLDGLQVGFYKDH